MPNTLYLLDAMALVYRAHFALIQRPIVTSKGVNTSALYGFTQTLLDVRDNRRPTHLAVVFDTPEPTERHRLYPEYKAQREAMPEELSQALPHVRRMVEAFNLPVLRCDGFEADDLIGTLVRRAEPDGFECWMVTPDKDFGQLVTLRTFLYRPGRTGSDAEILGPAEVCARWGIQRPDQVIDILGLMGDASDNIPGVPGIGEKTASKLIARYGSIETLLEHVTELTGKQRENVDRYRDQALLSKRLATINCEVPLAVTWDDLAVRPPDISALEPLLVEFEFNSLGRRLLGENFRAGRGFAASTATPAAPSPIPPKAAAPFPEPPTPPAPSTSAPRLGSLADTAHDYRVAETPETRAELKRLLADQPRVALACALDDAGSRDAGLRSIAFSWAPHSGWLWPIATTASPGSDTLADLRDVLQSTPRELIGLDVKRDLAALRRAGLDPTGRWFDVALAHAVIEPDQRHSLDYLAEAFLGYTPIATTPAPDGQKELGFDLDGPAPGWEAVVERADLAGQLPALLEPQLATKGQTRVFWDIEMPLVPVLVDMEAEGIRVDARALADFSEQLSRDMADQERAIHQLAGGEFNVNSPRQLGEVLFEKLRLSEKAKKTRTGQYATDEATLSALAGDHEIVRRLLEHREASKLKSTYADALPAAIDARTGRVHTTYQQLATATGRLNSQNPNLQNIPIRTGLGQEIRKAFVPRDDQHLLLSADYSQIELRIIAGLSREPGLLEAFASGADVHTTTAARVYSVPADQVTPEMRKKAKMVNYGIAYGISAFGLAQRLAIPRAEAAQIIEHYFAQFAGIRQFMDQTIAFAREHGYVQTVTGRRRYLRDINSANATVRGAAERNAINAPIQGTAADMIKIAMARIHHALAARRLRTRMLLQVHDELVFDLFIPEQAEVSAVVEEHMRTALPLEVPIEVELGVGRHWLEAH